MPKKIKKLMVCLLAICLMAGNTIGVLAEVPYRSYNYSFEGTKTDSPPGYVPTETITGYDLGISHFRNPQDLFVDHNHNIYVMDTDNARVVVMDSDFNLIRVMDQFTYNGKPYQLRNPQGLFVSEKGEIFICSKERLKEDGSLDESGGEVIVCDENGVISRTYGKPVTPYLDESKVFAPKKVVVDSQDVLYVLSDNINEGIVQMDPAGNFLGFFGAEKVAMSAADIANYYWAKLFYSDAQWELATGLSFQPTEYSDMYIDDEDFIYTTNAYEKLETGQIKRLNPKGSNVLDATVKFGDLKETIKADETIVKQSFIDITADPEQFIFALDKNVGRVYVYNQSSELLMIFGDIGTRVGTFANPVSIENIDGKILVLDRDKANITVFEPTYYGEKVREGIMKYEKGLYEEALEPWREVRDMNSNYEYAYTGIGRAELLLEDYKTSMKDFKLANDRDGYSKAKKEDRTETARKNFTLIFVIVVLLIVALIVYSKTKTKIKAYFKNKFGRRKGGEMK